MALTTSRSALNTFETAVTGGTNPTANKIIHMADWAMRLEPEETPILSAVGIGSEIDQDIVYWGQSYQTPFVSAAAEDLAQGETDLDVTSSTGVYFNWPYAVLAITDYATGSTTRLDHSTRELIQVSSVSTDTLAITRAFGGTSDVAHSSGARVELVSVAMPQNTDFALVPVTFGDQKYNYFSRLYEMVQADDAERNQPTYENPTDVLIAKTTEKTKMLKLLLEKTILFGGRQRGQGTGGVPSAMGGLDTFITTNVTNAGGANISIYSIEAELRDLWTAVGNNKATTLLMSANTAAIFDTSFNPYRQATMSDTTGNFQLDSIKFRFGTFNVAVSRWVPDGIIYGVNLKDIKVHPFKGRNWQQKILATDGPYSKIAVSGDFTLIVKREQAMFKLWNFQTDLLQYNGGDWFGA